MAIRYQIKWNDIDENQYTCDIAHIWYTGATTQIDGWGSISFDAGENLWQPIRSRAVELNLVATTAEDLSDLFDQEDRYWDVVLYKNGVEQFRGNLDTDEVEQPYNSDVWVIKAEARDALGWLEDLAFVDTGGLQWTGSDTVMSTLAKAIKRGYDQPIFALPFRVLTGWTLANDSSFIENAYLEQDLFLDNNDEPESCKKVVEDILKSMGCVIFQKDTHLYIINTYLWATTTNTAFTLDEYDADGVSLGSTYEAYGVGARQKIGSHIHNNPLNEVFHVNESTSYFHKKFIHSVRNSHKYELRDQILPNGEIITEGTGPYTLPKWTVVPAETAIAPDLLIVKGYEFDNERVLAATSASMELKQGNQLRITFEVEYVDDPTEMAFKVKLVDGGDTYYYAKNVGQSNAEWKKNATGDWQILHFSPSTEGIEQGFFTHVVDVVPLPVDGTMTLEVHSPVYGAAFVLNESQINISSISIEGVEIAEEGKEYTSSRTDNSKGRVLELEEIRLGNADTSVIKNAYYDSNGDLINLTGIKYNGAVDIMHRSLNKQKILLFQERTHVIDGEFKGDIDNLKVKRMDEFGNTSYMVSSWGLDLTTGISRCKIIGMNTNATGDTYLHEDRYVYKQSVKPKIKD